MTAGKIWRQTGLKHANEVLKFNRTTYKINNGQSVMVPFDNEKNPLVHFFRRRSF